MTKYESVFFPNFFVAPSSLGVSFRHWGFVIPSSFVFRASSFSSEIPRLRSE
jgi:hypothetical protein